MTSNAECAYEYNRRRNQIATYILDNGLPPEWAEAHEIEDIEGLLPAGFEYGNSGRQVSIPTHYERIPASGGASDAKITAAIQEVCRLQAAAREEDATSKDHKN